MTSPVRPTRKPLSRDEERVVLRRVLRFVDRYLARADQDLLRTDGKGVATFREIRMHIGAALKLKVRRPRAS